MFSRRASLIAMFFLVGINDKDQVWRTAHVLDATKGALELVLLAREVEPLLLSVPRRAPPDSSSSSLRRRWIELEIVFQLVSVPPSQRELT